MQGGIGYTESENLTPMCFASGVRGFSPRSDVLSVPPLQLLSADRTLKRWCR